MLDYADFVAINKFDRPARSTPCATCASSTAAATALRPSPRRRAAGLRHHRQPVHDHGVPTPSTRDAGGDASSRDFGERVDPRGHRRRAAGEPQRHPVIRRRARRLPARDIATVARLQSVGRGQIRVADQLYQLVGARAILCAREGDGDSRTCGRPVRGDHRLTSAVLRAPARRPRRRDPPPRPRARARLAGELLAAWPRIQSDYAARVQLHGARPVRSGSPSPRPLAGTEVPKVQLPAAPDLARHPPLPFPRERTRRLPVHRRRLPAQAHRTSCRPGCSPARAAPSAPTSASTYLAEGQPANRLSTAFDSVTLYGEDPHDPPRHLGQGR